jgi:putative sigma-54 modulation protein
MNHLAFNGSYLHNTRRRTVMNILISGHHLELTPAIRAYAENKLERVTRHFDQIVEIAITLGVERPSEKERRHKAEVNLRLKGDTIHVESHAESVYAAIDILEEKVDRQVMKFKGKVKDHRQNGAKHLQESSSVGEE